MQLKQQALLGLVLVISSTLNVLTICLARSFSTFFCILSFHHSFLLFLLSQVRFVIFLINEYLIGLHTVCTRTVTTQTEIQQWSCRSSTKSSCVFAVYFVCVHKYNEYVSIMICMKFRGISNSRPNISMYHCIVVKIYM